MIRISFILFVAIAIGCAKTSNREAKLDERITITSFDLETIPDSLSGCSCLFSETEEDYSTDKYLYFDDIGENAVISINGNVILLKHDNKEENYSNGQYTALVTNKKKIEDGYEATVYSAELIITDRYGVKISKKIYGICGC